MNLDHPCKETCSGWKQGFERGVESMSGVSKQRIRFAEEIAELKTIIKEMSDHSKGYAHRGLDMFAHTKWRKFADEL